MNTIKRQSLRRLTGALLFSICFVCGASLFAEPSPPGAASDQLDLQGAVPFPQLLPPYNYKPKPSAPSDPIGPIADQMQDVVGDLHQMKTDTPVQEKQKEVVGALDVVIKQLEAQCKGNGGGNPNPTKPMNRSVLAKGPGGSGPLHDAQAGTRVWGQLPPKEREKILQSQTEGFPAGYESVLANYYSRLAQEQVTGETSSANPSEPTTRPAAP